MTTVDELELFLSQLTDQEVDELKNEQKNS
jgi:hypothetical protein